MAHKFELVDDPYYPMGDWITGALGRYLNNGIPAGSFLMAVLENNLCEAFARADIGNTVNMKNIVGYVYNHVPSAAWGSKEKVTNWMNSFKTEKEA